MDSLRFFCTCSHAHIPIHCVSYQISRYADAFRDEPLVLLDWYSRLGLPGLVDLCVTQCHSVSIPRYLICTVGLR
jgi:hypothetical protein